ncbi:hypothetical protein JMUB5695_03111 [Mycobacterium heckeshornense]|uniref:hypothetical protein n=1 Tax=Mycobacterium heckeshornense TaxID=110505 RepID=UPI001942FEAB|nr:hypothetical protein [Mycobacterium heckeshornense]BCQ09661.1 hypothetical protein JMUB5695_03111 [Mycobacterium heckeshornense]
MPELTPQRASQIGKIGAYASWAVTSDRSARTAPARRRFLDRFEREVDPTGELPATERAQRAEAARKAYFLRLALRSADARRARRRQTNPVGAAQ